MWGKELSLAAHEMRSEVGPKLSVRYARQGFFRILHAVVSGFNVLFSFLHGLEGWFETLPSLELLVTLILALIHTLAQHLWLRTSPESENKMKSRSLRNVVVT